MLLSFRVDLSAHGVDPFVIRPWHILVGAVSLFLGPIAGEYLAVQPSGSKFPLEFVVTLVMFPIVLGVPLSLLAMIFSRRQRRGAAVFFVLGVAGAIIFVAGDSLGRRIRRQAFEQLAIRSAAVVDAIQAYEAKNGSPPQELDELTPEFLSSVPRTGLGAYPRFHIVTGEKARTNWDGNPWALYVDCGVGMNFDRFIYLPLQNYPKQGFGGSLERIGSWAYVHE